MHARFRIHPSLLVLLVLSCNEYEPQPMKNTAPIVSITSPTDGSGFDEGEVIAFAGRARDSQDDPEYLLLTWHSDIDQILSEKGSPDSEGIVTFATANLSPGTHTITLTVTDTGGLQTSDWVSVLILDLPDAPEIDIVHPTPAEDAVEGEFFTFEAFVSDAMTPASDLLVDFESDIDGVFCEPTPTETGEVTCDAELSVGEHLLTFTVYDVEGFSASATREFDVLDIRDHDDDRDGYTENEGDCDDDDRLIHPTATELCDGVDQDCDGTLDESTACYDDDGDCYCELAPCAGSITSTCTTPAGNDCDDSAASIHPYAEEVCDGRDQDCDLISDEGTDCYDDDGDGYHEGTGDCDDAAALSYPGAPELADGADNDCDGVIDEGTSSWDDDGDCLCESLPCLGTISVSCGALGSGDCDDTDPGIPTSVERCNGKDDDCDGLTDEEGSIDAVVWFADLDEDGFGDPTESQIACDAPEGYVEDDTDCDDMLPEVNPDATEICNEIDDDCDDEVDDGVMLTFYADIDLDGYGDASSWSRGCEVLPGYVGTASDCDDSNPRVNPAAAEACNGSDDDCDGAIDETGASGAPTWYQDSDGDLYGNPLVSQAECVAPAGFVSIAGDCDDTSSAVNPLATESCNGRDDDCDGTSDEADASDSSWWYYDGDADSFGSATTRARACYAPPGYVSLNTDCDDTRSSTHPGATETCDSIDNDCDGLIDDGATSTYYRDADSDGYGNAALTIASCAAPAGYVSNSADCDDTRVAVYPGATETCNSLDDDCDSAIDEAGASGETTWFRDFDLDSYGDASTSLRACAAPSGYVGNDDDCDDARYASRPLADEYCNSIDDDCDGVADESPAVDAPIWYLDGDSDTYGLSSSTTQACTAPPGYAGTGGDCDDSRATAYPGAPESCNSLDDDCDGSTDEGVTTTYWLDADVDGFGNPLVTRAACSLPSGYASNDDDCNDASALISPSATEICNSVDDDCDSVIDEPDSSGAPSWFRDRDSDGFGDPTDSTVACAAPSGYVALNTDCDDSNGAIHPAALESCDGVDNDCDRVTDEADSFDAPLWYLDSDLDGYGGSGVTTRACSAPAGYLSTSTDCDDAIASIYPGAPESCNSRDDDCDGTTDEGVTSTFYRDSDVDGYGNPVDTTAACAAPSGYVTNNLDCNDTDATINPTTPWYLDADYDGYGASGYVLTQCVQPSGYVGNDDDCNDASIEAYPGHTESCDTIDNDCDGTIDEAGALDCTIYYYDSDTDGFGREDASRCACSSTGHYTATTATDCYDSSSLVYPESTAYYTTDRGDDSFDYNCDDVETPRYTANWYCTVTVPYISCTSSNGWRSSTDPACGESATWNIGCSVTGFDTCSRSSYETRTQSCR